MLRLRKPLIAVFLLGACAGHRVDGACSVNSPAEVDRIRTTKLTDSSLRASLRIAAAQDDAGLMPIPGYPLCWGLRTIADQASSHRSTRDALARVGLTPVQYAATLINVESYRHPEVLGWPDRQHWSALMLANERAVMAFDHALAQEVSAEHIQAEPRKN